LEHLLSAWSEVAKQLRGASHVLLLLDYDGTLTPIVQRPELADLPQGVKQLLEALARQRRLTLAIISGRALVDVKEKVGIGDIFYAGNHGLEIEGPGISFVSPLAEEFKLVLRRLYHQLSQALGAIKGVLVEDKGLTLSVHYRQVADDRGKEVRDVFERITGDTAVSGKIRLTSGKKVYEIRPAVAWDKGKVVKIMMEKCGGGEQKGGLLPVYIGDDLTDEDAFRAIEDYKGGISVFVGGGDSPSSARYFLGSPDEVARFLSLLLEDTQ
jgi:trehalose 6-phosphate phosphatase